MGLQGVSQTSIALLRPGEELDQRSSLHGISLHLLLQSSHETFSAGDDPGLPHTVVDDGTARKSDQQMLRLVTEPGNKGKLKLSLSSTGEMKSTVSTVSVGREEVGEGVVTVSPGLRVLLLLFNVVQT